MTHRVSLLQHVSRQPKILTCSGTVGQLTKIVGRSRAVGGRRLDPLQLHGRFDCVFPIAGDLIDSNQPGQRLLAKLIRLAQLLIEVFGPVKQTRTHIILSER